MKNRGAYETTAYESASDAPQGRPGQGGFSLLEVLACIAVLAILCVPILRSFVNSADYNRRAFDMQNVTAFTQSVTELVKSVPREEFEAALEAKCGVEIEAPLEEDKRPPEFSVSGIRDLYPDECFTVYTYTCDEISIQGKSYDLKVVYDPLPYSEKVTEEEKQKAINEETGLPAHDVNVFTAAGVGAVDDKRFAVIADEINCYETARVAQPDAILYNLLGRMSKGEQERLKALLPEGADEEACLREVYQNTTKEVKVTIHDVVGKTDVISIQCDVTYTLNLSALLGGGTLQRGEVKLTYNVYRAEYELEGEKSGDEWIWERGGKIFVFAKAWQDQKFYQDAVPVKKPDKNVIIIENQHTGDKNPLDVYLVRGYYSSGVKDDGQEPVNPHGLQFDRVEVNGEKYSEIPWNGGSGEFKEGNTHFYTNIKRKSSSFELISEDMNDTLGREKASLNCYEVTISLTERENGEGAGGREVGNIVTTKLVR